MDVISDELLRQAALWRTLTENGTDALQKETEHRAGQSDTENARESGRAARGAAESAAPPGGALRSGETGDAAAAGLRDAADMAAGAGRGRSAKVADSVAAAGWDAGSLYFFEESPAAEPARALSCLFERDARRYDGGFALY